MVQELIKEQMEISILVHSKMDSSTVKERRTMEMVTFTEDNSSMDFLKDMENIYGKIQALIEEISNKDKDQGTESGNQVNTDSKIIKVTTMQIRKQAMESTHGTMAGLTKATSTMTIVMDLDNCLILNNNSLTEEIGSMEINLERKNLNSSHFKWKLTTTLNKIS